MTILCLGAAFVFASSVFFIGIVEALWLTWLYVGIALLCLGILLMSNDRFRERYYLSSIKSPEWERVYSEKEKKLFHKYYFPFRGILGGASAITLYWTTHQHIFATLSVWLRMNSRLLYALCYLVIMVWSFYDWNNNRSKDNAWFLCFSMIGFFAELIYYFVLISNVSQTILSITKSFFLVFDPVVIMLVIWIGIRSSVRRRKDN